MAIPNAMIMKVCSVLMREDGAHKCFDVLVEKALEDAGVGQLIHELRYLRSEIAADLSETGYTESDILEHLRAVDYVLAKVGAA